MAMKTGGLEPDRVLRINRGDDEVVLIRLYKFSVGAQIEIGKGNYVHFSDPLGDIHPRMVADFPSPENLGQLLLTDITSELFPVLADAYERMEVLAGLAKMRLLPKLDVPL